MDISKAEIPKPRKESENSNYCVFVILVTQIPIACIFGLNLGVLNTASPVMEIFINDTYTNRYGISPSNDIATMLLTLAHSCLVWGSLPGALLVNLTLHKLSRKKACLLIHAMSTIATVLMGPISKYGKSYESFIVGRFIAGISRGLAFSITMVIVAETTCRRKLGYYQSPFSVTVFVSSAVGASLGHYKVLGSPSLWQWAVFAPAIASVVYFCAYRWLPETPVSLLRMGQVDEALKTLRRLRVGGGENTELEMLQNEISEQSKSKQYSFVEMMKTPQLRLQFFVSVMAMNCVQLVGIQAIFMYSDSNFIQAGVDSRYVSYATIGLYLQSIPAFALFVPLQRKYGTKRIVLAGVTICNFGYIIFILSNALHKIMPWTSYLAIVGMCIVMFGVQFGPQLCMLSLPSELSTAASRPTIAFHSGNLFWTLGSVIAYVFPYSVASWQAMAYVPFPILGIILSVFYVKMMPETNRRSTAQIQSSFRKKSMVSTISISNFRDRFHIS